MDVECDRLATASVKLSSGRDLRIHVRDLADTRVAVDDLGGYWVGVIGAGTRKLRLSAGGDVTLVTSEHVLGAPPDNILGHIEAPSPNAFTSEG